MRRRRRHLRQGTARRDLEGHKIGRARRRRAKRVKRRDDPMVGHDQNSVRVPERDRGHPAGEERRALDPREHSGLRVNVENGDRVRPLIDSEQQRMVGTEQHLVIAGNRPDRVGQRQHERRPRAIGGIKRRLRDQRIALDGIRDRRDRVLVRRRRVGLHVDPARDRPARDRRIGRPRDEIGHDDERDEHAEEPRRVQGTATHAHIEELLELGDHDPLPGVRPLDDFQDQLGHGAEAYMRFKGPGALGPARDGRRTPALVVARASPLQRRHSRYARNARRPLPPNTGTQAGPLCVCAGDPAAGGVVVVDDLKHHVSPPQPSEGDGAAFARLASPLGDFLAMPRPRSDRWPRAPIGRA